MEVATGATVQIMYGGEVSDLVAEGVTFEQQEMITVSEISSAGTSITFTGTGFPANLIGHASIGGIDADVVAVTSETEATASWSTTGIPQSTEVPNLYFGDDGLGYKLHAKLAVGITFEKVQEVVSSTSSLECSFAGGCNYAIESEGLYATLLD